MSTEEAIIQNTHGMGNMATSPKRRRIPRYPGVRRIYGEFERFRGDLPAVVIYLSAEDGHDAAALKVAAHKPEEHLIVYIGGPYNLHNQADIETIEDWGTKYRLACVQGRKNLTTIERLREILESTSRPKPGILYIADLFSETPFYEEIKFSNNGSGTQRKPPATEVPNTLSEKIA